MHSPTEKYGFLQPNMTSVWSLSSYLLTQYKTYPNSYNPGHLRSLQATTYQNSYQCLGTIQQHNTLPSADCGKGQCRSQSKGHAFKETLRQTVPHVYHMSHNCMRYGQPQKLILSADADFSFVKHLRNNVNNWLVIAVRKCLVVQTHSLV